MFFCWIPSKKLKVSKKSCSDTGLTWKGANNLEQYPSIKAPTKTHKTARVEDHGVAAKVLRPGCTPLYIRTLRLYTYGTFYLYSTWVAVCRYRICCMFSYRFIKLPCQRISKHFKTGSLASASGWQASNAVVKLCKSSRINMVLFSRCFMLIGVKKLVQAQISKRSIYQIIWYKSISRRWPVHPLPCRRPFTCLHTHALV